MEFYTEQEREEELKKIENIFQNLGLNTEWVAPLLLEVNDKIANPNITIYIKLKFDPNDEVAVTVFDYLYNEHHTFWYTEQVLTSRILYWIYEYNNA